MSKFKPFMLKIETEKEAKVLWHILNCPMLGTSKDEWLLVEIGKTIKNCTEINDRLWNRFNKKYLINRFAGGK